MSCSAIACAGGRAGNILAVLPPAAGDALIAAALRLAAAGFRIVPADPVPAPVSGDGELALPQGCQPQGSH